MASFVKILEKLERLFSKQSNKMMNGEEESESEKEREDEGVEKEPERGE